MRRILLSLLLILSLTSCYSIPKDKQKHFLAGAVTSGLVVTFTDDPKQGCVAATVAGIGKEIHDSYTHPADPRDALATSLGCLVWYLYKELKNGN